MMYQVLIITILTLNLALLAIFLPNFDMTDELSLVAVTFLLILTVGHIFMLIGKKIKLGDIADVAIPFFLMGLSPLIPYLIFSPLSKEVLQDGRLAAFILFELIFYLAIFFYYTIEPTEAETSENIS